MILVCAVGTTLKFYSNFNLAFSQKSQLTTTASNNARSQGQYASEESKKRKRKKLPEECNGLSNVSLYNSKLEVLRYAHFY